MTAAAATSDLPAGRPTVVIDTNWVLDLCVFTDPRAVPLREAVETRQVAWVACPHMRAELERVLTYPAVTRSLQAQQRQAADALAWFDAHHCPVDAPPPSGWRCKDPDDQVFIDLAAAHRATLVSKDKAVLALRRRLERGGATATAHWPVPSARTAAVRPDPVEPSPLRGGIHEVAATAV